MTNNVKRCDRTDMLERECAHCLGHDNIEVRDWVGGKPFPARYAGRCARCNYGFEIGHLICHVEDESDYVHAACAEVIAS